MMAIIITFDIVGFQALLQEDRKDVLALMYRLLSRVHALDKLRECMIADLKVRFNMRFHMKALLSCCL
jgi:hypothetical protein